MNEDDYPSPGSDRMNEDDYPSPGRYDPPSLALLLRLLQMVAQAGGVRLIIEVRTIDAKPVE